MIETMPQVFDIQVVRAIQPSNGTLAVIFGSGLVARLPPEDPNRDTMVREAESSLQHRRPVGVLVNGAGRLRERELLRELAL